MKNKNISFFITAFIFAVLFCISNFTLVFSAQEVGGNVEEIDSLQKQINAKKEKIAQLEQSIADFKKKIQEKHLEVVSLGNQLGILDTRVEEITTDIQATQEKLDVLQLQVSQAQLAIDQKYKQITRQKNIVGELVRSLHEQDEKNYIEIVASHDNFSDFYNQLHYTKTV